MAIKGKTKRSQGRPVRRPATAPRMPTVERRPPWYRAVAFQPGMASAGDLVSGKAKPRDFQVRATSWASKIGEIRQKVANVTVGKPEAVTGFNGVPVNNVGGHVPMLTSVRDAYTAALGFYAQAASAYQRAAEAPAKSQLAQKLATQAQSDQVSAGAAMDQAAALLARIMASYDLNVQQQLPGESSTAFGNRTGASQVPTGGSGGIPTGIPAGGGAPAGGDQGTQPGQGNQ